MSLKLMRSGVDRYNDESFVFCVFGTVGFVLVLLFGVYEMTLQMGDNEPNVSFCTGLMEMSCVSLASGDPKFRVRDAV